MAYAQSSRTRKLVAGGALALTVVTATAASASAAPPNVTLIGYGVLPATTFAAGPPSGAAISPNVNNGITSPFASQPVQGFSAVHSVGNGTFMAMADNGFGAKGNSADFNLRVYTIEPGFETGTVVLPAPLLPGTGAVSVLSHIELTDPNNLIPFGIVNGAGSRVLTGGDFDPESMQVMADGTIWIGEEFGPYLLHFSATGVLLDAPIPLPDFSTPDPLDELKSPSNPTLAGGIARVPGSGGFEGMAKSPDGTKLFPLLERPLDNVGSTLLIHEFDVATKSYTGYRWGYQLTAADPTTTAGTNIGDFVMSDTTTGLIIERNGNQGSTDPLVSLKRIYKVTLAPGVPGGVASTAKELTVDLLSINDPETISLPGSAGDSGLGTTFSFPFVTIEDVAIIDPQTILVMNDNNFPFSRGRHLGTGAPDDNEMIVLRLNDTGPLPVVPETPLVPVLLVSALAGAGAILVVRQRRLAAI